MELPSNPPPFTFRSASSPAYSLPSNTQGLLSRSRRGGGGAGCVPGNPRDETIESEAALTEKRPTPPLAPPPQAPPPQGQRRQNGAESCAERGATGGQVDGAGGTTAGRKLNLTGQSERGGGASSEEGRLTGELTGRRGGTTIRRAESQGGRVEGGGDVAERGGSQRLTRTLNSAPSALGGEEGRTGAELSRTTLGLERAGGGLSLPTRLRVPAGSGLRDAGTDGSQSIWKRIERLYGSEKADDSNQKTKRYSAPIGDWTLPEPDGGGAFAQRRKSTTDFLPTSSPIGQWRRGSCEGGGGGGSFPRRLVRGERVGVDTTQASLPTEPPVSALGRERSPGGLWQGQAQGKPPDLGQNAWKRGVPEYNTRSLDRVRSKLTVAAPSRVDWSAHVPSGEDTSKPLSNPAVCPPPGDREERAGERRTIEEALDGERQGGVVRGNERVGERTSSPECKQGLEKEVTSPPEPSGVTLGSRLLSTNQMNSRATPDPSCRTLACGRGMAREGSITEDVFEPSQQRSTAQTSDRRMLAVPSVASVKNKIHQFEALTQKTQRDFQKPRRALSVPEHMGSKAGERASQPWSAGGLRGRRGRWEEGKEERDEVDSRGEQMRGAMGKEVKSSGPVLGGVGRLGGVGGLGGEGEGGKDKVKERGWAVRSASVDETGLRWEREAERREKERREKERREKEREERREKEREKEREAERREKEREERKEKERKEKEREERREKEREERREKEREAERREKEREAERREKEREAERMEKEREAEGGGVQERGQSEERESGASKLKLEIPFSGGPRERPLRVSPVDETSSSRPSEPQVPLSPLDRTRRKEAASIKLLNFNNNCSGPERVELQNSPDLLSPVSDDDKTPTNPPQDSPFYPQQEALEAGRTQEGSGGSPVFTATAQPHTSSQETNSHVGGDSLVPPLPLSSPYCLPQSGGDLEAWVTSLNQKIERWDSDEEEEDEGTEKDEDSNYDSDESSVTITSNMSQSDRRSFCLSLAELCNFGGVEYESEAEMEDWPPGRSASLSSDMSAFSCVSVLDTEELDRLLDDVRSLGDDTLQNYEDVQVVVLHKEVGVGLGFTVAGGEDQNKPVTVHRVFSSGVAAQEGSIREGDLILSINGTSLSGSAHWQALRTLRKARTLGMGVVVLRRGVASKTVKGVTGGHAQGHTLTPPTDTGQRLCVRLQKGSRDMGFSLEGGLGCNQGDRPLSIQKIFLGGPTNKVCPGDELLEIQGVSVVGMRRLEAWTLIRRLPPGPVDVVLHRPANVGLLS